MAAKSLARVELLARRREIHSFLGDYKFLIESHTLPAIISLIPNNSKVAGYYPINTEFDCLHILRCLYLTHNFEVCLPIVANDKILKFKLWDCKDSSLINGRYNIPMPVDRLPYTIPDAIIVPMLGFNKDLSRIGYGGGYYDSTLKEYSSAISIGIAFRNQLCENIPIESHDAKLDYIVTENGLFIG